MLHVKPCLETEKCENFYRTDPVCAAFCEGIDVGLYVDEILVGSARVGFDGDAAVLSAVWIMPEIRGKGLGDFLTRATMDAYTQSLPRFKVAYESDYFLKFGFKKGIGEMEIKSEDIHFPSHCKGDI